jgi:hypothetical protein
MASDSDDGYSKAFQQQKSAGEQSPGTITKAVPSSVIGNTLGGPKTATQRYPDVHDFDMQTAGEDDLSIDHYESISDHVFVRNHVTGQVYSMTSAEANQRNIRGSLQGKHFRLNSINPRPVPGRLASTTPAIRVHILHQGYALCNFSQQRPVDWPVGHEQVSLTAYKEGASISCKDCAQLADKLLGCGS